ncbi:hypothetical protein [Leifsonia aquatica]|uniref:hypothetical protein n=1 Tax=Leifsonia aquatica TaxID=144185 RepID=UPI0038171AE7
MAVGVCTVGGLLTGFTPANASESAPLAALTAATPETVAKAADVATTATGANAVDATVSGTNVTVPVDPSSGISLGGADTSITVGLPFAKQANDANVETAGVVSYDNNNGSTTVPVVRDDGTLQINTVIEKAAAPKRYDYPLTIPEGQSLQLSADGSAYIGTEDASSISAYIPAPWAKDANGTPVVTHFEVSGDVLTQVVDFTAETVFPVVADPQFEWYSGLPTVKTTRTETKQLAGIGAGPTGPGGAAKACGALLKVAGPVGIAAAALCAVNIVSIMFNASKAYNSGQCARLLIGPGVIGTISYKDSYCR